MILLGIGFLLLQIQAGFTSVVVKNADTELYKHQIIPPYEKEPINMTLSSKHNPERVIDVKNLFQSEMIANPPKKNRRGDKVKRKKERHGKPGRQRSKSQKAVDFDNKHVLRNNEKVTLVRNRTIEILKNKVRILSANENYTSGGNKSTSRVDETLLEKILSSAVSKPDILISASGIYKLPIGGNIYSTKQLARSEVTEENMIVSGSQNRTEINTNFTELRGSKEKNENKKLDTNFGDSSKDYEYEYDAFDDFKDSWNNRKDYNKTFDKPFSRSPDYESMNLDYNIGTTLEQIVSILENITDSKRNCSCSDCSQDESIANDPCQKWLECKGHLESAFLGDNNNLPSCPCHYPSTIFYDDKIWDEKQGRYFRWRGASSETERLDVYKPGATYCIRSLLAQGSSTISCQHCCYDRDLQLLTRGSGAGTVNFVSPDVSKQLHDTVDMLPWRLCKGDFTRYNTARQPDNGNNCSANPNDENFQLQVEFSKHF